MAVSSIFHNVVLDTPEKVQAFVDAIDASLADPYVRPKGPMYKVTSDRNEILHILEMNEKNRKVHK